MRRRENGALKISRAIFLGLVTISLISLSLVSTPLGVSAAASIIRPLPPAPIQTVPPAPTNPPGPCKVVFCGGGGIILPPAPITQGANCPTSFNPSDYPRYISKFNDSWANTVPTAINNLGQVAGSFTPAPGQKSKGFVRNANGTFAPAPWKGPDYDVSLTGINDLGRFVGYYTDSDGFGHGFVRNAQGSETYFDVPGADSTTPNGINNLGQVIGTYKYPTRFGIPFIGNTYYAGFVREANGHITDLEFPHSD